MDSPKFLTGFGHWAGMGLMAAVIALFVAYLFPSVIPTKATATRL